MCVCRIRDVACMSVVVLKLYLCASIRICANHYTEKHLAIHALVYAPDTMNSQQTENTHTHTHTPHIHTPHIHTPHIHTHTTYTRHTHTHHNTHTHTHTPHTHTHTPHIHTHTHTHTPRNTHTHMSPIIASLFQWIKTLVIDSPYSIWLTLYFRC